MIVRAAPSRIFGKCPGGHQKDDELIIAETTVTASKLPKAEPTSGHGKQQQGQSSPIR